jgi:hypothetical protein
MIPTCKGSHRFILHGKCPLCEAIVENGHLIADPPIAISLTPQWDIEAMIRAAAQEPLGTAADAMLAVRLAGSNETAFRVFNAGVSRDVRSIAYFAMIAIRQFVRNGLANRIDESEKLVESQGMDGLALRFMLLITYFVRKKESADPSHPRRIDHIKWIVTHYPECYALETQECLLSIDEDPVAFSAIRSLWEEWLRQKPHDTRVLGNAANFLGAADFQFAESLYRRAKLLEPTNPGWPKALARHYSKYQQFALAQSEYQDALLKAIDSLDRLDILPNLAESALGANDLRVAESAAAELALLGREPQFRLDSSEILHQSLLLLGRCALSAGGVETAKSYLLQAAENVCASASRINLRLAKELLEGGQTNVVVDYLRRTAACWTSNSNDVDEWIRAIESGLIPDFGPMTY